MSIRSLLLAATMILPAAALAQDGIKLMDKRAFVHLLVDELESTDAGGENDIAWDVDLWVGSDFRKFWMKTQGEQSDREEDRTELQFLYSKAILPFWDLQAGVRRDLDGVFERNWGVIGLTGLAPYFFDVEAELFFAEGGQSSIRLRGEIEYLLTQRLILTPELEIVGYGRDERNRFIGSGLSEIEFDLRLRYEFKRELAPYIGVTWHRLQGSTADIAAISGRDESDTVLTIGLRTWF